MTAQIDNSNFIIVCDQCSQCHGFTSDECDVQLIGGEFCGDCFCGGILSAVKVAA
jgi:hypothetical protein